MPFVAPVIAAVAAAVAWLGPVGMAILSTVITTAIGFVARALAPKPKAPEFTPFSAVVADRTQMIRQPIVKRRYPFGEMKLGGILVNMISAADNAEHRMIVVLCDGPIDGIPVVWFDDQPIYPDQIDGDGEVTAGPFAGKANIEKYLGEFDQGANPNLPPEFYGRGIAYIDALIRWDQDVYPQGLPNVSAEVRGLKFLDPRDSVTRFTINSAIIARGLLANQDWGGRYPDSYLPDTWFNAAANICDEFVTAHGDQHPVASVDAATDTFKLAGAKLLFQTGDRVEVASDGGSVPTGTPSPGYVIVVRSRNRGPAPDWEVGFDGDGAEKIEIRLADTYADALAGTPAALSDAGSGTMTITKTGEPRYTCNGLMESNQAWLGILEQIVQTMAGRAVDSGGEWRIRAGAYATPEVEIVPRDIVAPPKIQTRVPRRDRFNLIQGKYYNPLNDWQPADWPAVADAAYIEEDQEEIPRAPLDLPFVTRGNHAQRIGQYELRRMRGNEITVELSCTLTAFELQSGDTFLLTLPDFGFEEKPFEVQTWELAVEEVENKPALVIKMLARETQASVYSFNPEDDETPVVPIARSALANPRRVPAPTGLSARTLATETESGDAVFAALFAWTYGTDSTVDQRGRFEIRFRRSTGRALLFDGVDDYVDFAADIDLVGDPMAFTIECQVLWDGTGSGDDHGIFTNGQAWLYRRASDGKIVGAIALDTSPVTIVEVESDAALAVDDFTHVALVWDGDDLILYVDGNPDDTAAASGDLIAAFIDAQWGRGLSDDPNTAYFVGALDDLRIWRHTARSEDEINDNMNAVLTGREPLLIGYWPADEKLVGIVSDASVTGNTGSLHGAVFTDGAVAPAYEPSWFVDGHTRQTRTPSLDAAVNYDLGVRAVNSLGVRSAWSQLLGFTVGSTAGAATTDDWGSVADDPPDTTADWGSVTDAPDTSDDWGSVI